MRLHNSTLWMLLLVCVLAMACSKNDGEGEGGSTDGDTDADSDSDTSAATDADTDSDSDADADADSDTDADTDPEVCDGVDNDGNGIIDDVDVGGDGICDCLNIGTIGQIGPWSSGGNIFAEWLTSRSSIPPVEIGDQVITPELLEGLDVIVVLRADTAPLDLADRDYNSPAHHEFSNDEVAALEEWVNGNGGLMTTIGYQGDESQEVLNVNRLLAPFGLGYQTESEYLQLTNYLTEFATHPITDGIEEIFTDNGVEPNPENGTPIAWGDNDAVAMVVGEPGAGKVIVFGDEWITYDSEWTTEDTEGNLVENPQIVLFWLNMLKWLTPAEECQVEIPEIIPE